MSSHPYFWTGFMSDDPSPSPGIPTPGRPTSYASVAGTRPHTSTRSSAVSGLLNPSFSDPSHFLLHQSSPFHDIRDNDRDMTGRDGVGGGAQVFRPAPGWRPKSPVLDPCSRAFEAFMAADAIRSDELASSTLPARLRHWISPTYLRGTDYMVKLEEQHRRRMQVVREGQHTQSHSGGLASSSSSHSLSGGKVPPPPTLHRGAALEVVEKAPGSVSPQDEKEDVSPLPSGWNKDDKHGGLQVMGDGFEVKYMGPRSSTDKDHEAYAIRADHHMPGECGVYYFEITVLNSKRSEDTTIIVGFSGKEVSVSRAPGWEPESWGYHGDDGKLFASQSTGKAYGPKFGAGDTIGCLINFRTATASFTKNGHDKGIAFRDNTFRHGKGKFFPIVGLKKPGDHIIANFGQLPFQFDIDGYVRAEKKKVWDKIRHTDTKSLVSGLSPGELCQQLVLQHLQHDGYVETARALAEEIISEKTRLRLDPKEPIKGISIRDDEDARKRQQIRRAILEGNIDQALKFTNTYYPRVLKVHEQVYFRLRCLKFIELIRKDAEENLKRDTGKFPAKSVHTQPQTDEDEMDLEQDEADHQGHHGWGERMEDDQPAVGRLVEDALEYGQELRSEFAESTDPEVVKHLDKIFALIAYENPLLEESVVHLLDRANRVTMAEELNSAILLSLGKSSRSALETMYADTVVLLGSLREEGGGGDSTFVSIQDILDRIPKPALRT